MSAQELKPGDRCLTLPHWTQGNDVVGIEVVLTTGPEVTKMVTWKGIVSISNCGISGQTKWGYPSQPKACYPTCALLKLPDDDMRREFEREAEREGKRPAKVRS